MSADKSVSRDLLSLENAVAASPFLISPGGSALGGFPFPSPPTPNAAFPLAPGGPPNSRLKTFPMPPPSALLARVAAFLPQLAAANQQLEGEIARSGAEAVNIETLDESKPHIEMNLDVGVLEAQRADDPEIIIPGVSPHAALAAAAAASSSCFASAIAAVAAHAETLDGDEDDDDSSDEDSEEQAAAAAAAQTAAGLSRAARKKKKYRARKHVGGATAMQDTNAEPLPKCQNPLIQEMEE